MAEPPPPPGSFTWRIFALASRVDCLLLRLTSGRRSLVTSVPTLVLHHLGRHSGRARTTPVIFLDDGARLVVVAANAGAATDPDWFRNLIAMPDAEVRLPGGERRRVRPRLAHPDERATLWPRLVELHTDFESYQDHTERQIPVVILEPAA